MSMEAPIRILIADDHPYVREGLVALLTQQRMHVIAEAVNGEQAVELYRQHHPDITLMDVRMPCMDGLTATKTIMTEFPQARIIILTNSDGEEANSRRAGAKTLLYKDVSGQELADTIRLVQQS